MEKITSNTPLINPGSPIFGRSREKQYFPEFATITIEGTSYKSFERLSFTHYLENGHLILSFKHEDIYIQMSIYDFDGNGTYTDSPLTNRETVEAFLMLRAYEKPYFFDEDFGDSLSITITDYDSGKNYAGFFIGSVENRGSRDQVSISGKFSMSR